MVPLPRNGGDIPCSRAGFRQSEIRRIDPGYGFGECHRKIQGGRIGRVGVGARYGDDCGRGVIDGIDDGIILAAIVIVSARASQRMAHSVHDGIVVVEIEAQRTVASDGIYRYRVRISASRYGRDIARSRAGLVEDEISRTDAGYRFGKCYREIDGCRIGWICIGPIYGSNGGRSVVDGICLAACVIMFSRSAQGIACSIDDGIVVVDIQA